MCLRSESLWVNSWTMARAWSRDGSIPGQWLWGGQMDSGWIRKRAPERARFVRHRTSSMRRLGGGLVRGVLGVRQLHDRGAHDEQRDQADDEARERRLHVGFVMTVMAVMVVVVGHGNLLVVRW